MGAIVDRSKEHLGPADRAVIIARQLLLQAVRTVQDGGAPPGVDESYYTVQAMHDLVPQEVEWREALLPMMYPARGP